MHACCCFSLQFIIQNLPVRYSADYLWEEESVPSKVVFQINKDLYKQASQLHLRLFCHLDLK